MGEPGGSQVISLELAQRLDWRVKILHFLYRYCGSVTIWQQTGSGFAVIKQLRLDQFHAIING